MRVILVSSEFGSRNYSVRYRQYLNSPCEINPAPTSGPFVGVKEIANNSASCCILCNLSLSVAACASSAAATSVSERSFWSKTSAHPQLHPSFLLLALPPELFLLLPLQCIRLLLPNTRSCNLRHPRCYNPGQVKKGRKKKLLRPHRSRQYN